MSPLPPYAAPVLLTGALLFIAFLFVEQRVKDPLIHLNIFRRRNLSLAALINVLVGYCLFIGLVSIPLLVNIRQESTADLRAAALEVGVLLSALTVPMAIAALPGGWLSERIGVRWTVLLGLGLALVGFVVKWQTWTLDMNNLVLAVQMAIIGVGIGLTFSPISTAIINSAYDEERGVASALVIILRLLGMTISVSSLSTYGLYRVNSLAALSNVTTLDANTMLTIYSEATLQVLGEMGLIGAVLCAVALIIALGLSHTIELPRKTQTNPL
jgi:MFS family permease